MQLLQYEAKLNVVWAEAAQRQARERQLLRTRGEQLAAMRPVAQVCSSSLHTHLQQRTRRLLSSSRAEMQHMHCTTACQASCSLSAGAICFPCRLPGCRGCCTGLLRGRPLCCQAEAVEAADFQLKPVAPVSLATTQDPAPLVRFPGLRSWGLCLNHQTQACLLHTGAAVLRSRQCAVAPTTETAWCRWPWPRSSRSCLWPSSVCWACCRRSILPSATRPAQHLCRMQLPCKGYR